MCNLSKARFKGVPFHTTSSNRNGDIMSHDIKWRGLQYPLCIFTSLKQKSSTFRCCSGFLENPSRQDEPSHWWPPTLRRITDSLSSGPWASPLIAAHGESMRNMEAPSGKPGVWNEYVSSSTSTQLFYLFHEISKTFECPTTRFGPKYEWCKRWSILPVIQPRQDLPFRALGCFALRTQCGSSILKVGIFDSFTMLPTRGNATSSMQRLQGETKGTYKQAFISFITQTNLYPCKLWTPCRSMCSSACFFQRRVDSGPGVRVSKPFHANYSAYKSMRTGWYANILDHHASKQKAKNKQS